MNFLPEQKKNNEQKVDGLHVSQHEASRML